MKKILLLEDEAPIARLLQAYLARERYEVRWDIWRDFFCPGGRTWCFSI
ncbi:hypothetical protein J27TS7_22470 [Paenibacillus dendritiformis]|nr:response regulator transcription factor [Paenibacillus dendritiformis]NKI20396.1 response regulator transcription factor [Paenibacillus dendritiformis]GIO72733.1 hypothetical protein J27TS7_22470 [Paenibacillus dendritiformis]